MRKTTVLMSLLLAAGAATAQEKVTVQLKWLPQAQFAGYYVAAAKGFYKDAGLDVTIKPGGPDIAPAQVLAANGADVTVDWMPSALAAREAGVPMVNVAQIFNRSGMMLTCKKSSGVATPKDFKGKTLGVWFGGNEYPFLSWMGTLGLQDQRRQPRRQGAEAGLQRRPAAAEPGGLRLDHDLQRVLADHRRRRQARPAGHLPLRRPGRGHAGRRPVRAWARSSRTRPSSPSWASSSPRR